MVLISGRINNIKKEQNRILSSFSNNFKSNQSNSFKNKNGLSIKMDTFTHKQKDEKEEKIFLENKEKKIKKIIELLNYKESYLSKLKKLFFFYINLFRVFILKLIYGQYIPYMKLKRLRRQLTVIHKYGIYMPEIDKIIEKAIIYGCDNKVRDLWEDYKGDIAENTMLFYEDSEFDKRDIEFRKKIIMSFKPEDTSFEEFISNLNKEKVYPLFGEKPPFYYNRDKLIEDFKMINKNKTD